MLLYFTTDGLLPPGPRPRKDEVPRSGGDEVARGLLLRRPGGPLRTL